MKTKKLYFGAAYYDEYMPVSRVDEDMRLMKEAGMNVIRIAESTWSTWEPREGEFDFRCLHRMLQGAKKYGIDVIVGTPTYAIPPWLAKKYPDILADTHA
ncbi:MAG: beta-galactosidase, partial [Oscillospiraceae bacterium]|nr:beta-galactosidase [Oscillospiraceae bacterium]